MLINDNAGLLSSSKEFSRLMSKDYIKNLCNIGGV